jgi:hypothetical protein
MRFHIKTDRAICAPRFEIRLKAAADLFDGASGNLSGRLSLYRQAGWSIKGSEAAYKSKKSIQNA